MGTLPPLDLWLGTLEGFMKLFVSNRKSEVIGQSQLSRGRRLAASRKRRLLVESLEQRNLLATLVVTPSSATIYENHGQDSSQPRHAGFRVTLSGADVVMHTSTRLEITGQVDAYVGGMYTTPRSVPVPTPNFREFDAYFHDYFEIVSTDDETIPVSSIVPGANDAVVDTDDFASDQLSVKVIATYSRFIGYNEFSMEIIEVATVSVNVPITIVDNDTPPPTRSVAIATTDSNASEPHNVYYLPSASANTGEATLTFTNWVGGTIGLSLAGTATHIGDYSISVWSAPVGTVLTGTNLFVPAGATSVKLRITPIGDLIETDGGETVVIGVASAPLGVTSSGSATVTIADELEGLTVTAWPNEALEDRTGPPYANFRITPDNPSAKMKGMVRLEINASAIDSAIPGIDYTLEVESPTLATLPISLVDPVKKIYRTDPFSIDQLNFQIIRVLPIADTLVEGNENIRVTLRSEPRYALPVADTGIHGNAMVTIIDTPQPIRTVSLAASDANATEPHNVYYLSSTTADTGEATLTFSNWIGGTVGLTLGGNATLNSDYTISLVDPPSGTTLTGLNLLVPTGVTNVKLLITPIGDAIETDGGETVILGIGAVPVGVTSSGTATVTIADELEGLTLTASPSETLEYRSDPLYANFRITPDSSTQRMKGLVFVDIDASAPDAAIPGVDYTCFGSA